MKTMTLIRPSSVDVLMKWTISLCSGVNDLLSGLALDWISSYLTDRYKQVKISVPFGGQGFVLGTLLFTVYTMSSLSAVIDHCSNEFNMLKLNRDKTNFILIGHEQQRKKYMYFSSVPLYPGVYQESWYHLLSEFHSEISGIPDLSNHASTACDFRRIPRHQSLDIILLKTTLSDFVGTKLDYTATST